MWVYVQLFPIKESWISNGQILKSPNVSVWMFYQNRIFSRLNLSIANTQQEYINIFQHKTHKENPQVNLCQKMSLNISSASTPCIDAFTILDHPLPWCLNLHIPGETYAVVFTWAHLVVKVFGDLFRKNFLGPKWKIVVKYGRNRNLQGRYIHIYNYIYIYMKIGIVAKQMVIWPDLTTVQKT